MDFLHGNGDLMWSLSPCAPDLIDGSDEFSHSLEDVYQLDGDSTELESLKGVLV